MKQGDLTGRDWGEEGTIDKVSKDGLWRSLLKLKPGRTKEPARQKWARGALQAEGTESSDLRVDTGDCQGNHFTL